MDHFRSTSRDESTSYQSLSNLAWDRSVIYLAALAIAVLFTRIVNQPAIQLPELNPKKRFEFTNRRRLSQFFQKSKELLTQGRTHFQNKLYKAYCDWGEVIIVSPEHIEELRSDPRLDFLLPANDDSHGYIPGFDAFQLDAQLAHIVTKHLTRALTKLTAPISTEAAVAFRSILTDSPEWHEVNPKEDLVRVVSRMSTRIFMGEELCRDDAWVKASGEYTLKAFEATDPVRRWPRLFRPYVHWFMPICWDLRRKLAEARRTLEPHIASRNTTKAAALAEGKPCPFDDLIEWWESEYGPSDNHVINQLTLTVVAIHTTSDLLQQTMIDIALHPELFTPLREEVINVLKTQGLTKLALYNLKLMDSVFKESQRLKPALLGLWRRQALADVTLSDGYVIKKGQKVLGDSTHMWSPDYYNDADKFDGFRFLKLRETPDKDDPNSKAAHLVSTSSKHLGFGHGLHSCPGRFFAANEVKIALCHLLLKYDWKLPEDKRPKSTWTVAGMSIIPDPSIKLVVKRRQEVIDIDSLLSLG